MRTAVLTIVRGRADHLRRQLRGISRSHLAPDLHVIVSMGDPDVRSLVAAAAADARVLDLPLEAHGELPLAAARNLGAAEAIANGADLLIFLDVDCIPDPTLIARYHEVAADPSHTTDVLCGPVAYLPPADEGGYDLDSLPTMASPHPARPAPHPGTVVRTTDRHLFWSLSFAVTARTWERIGGFCTAYVGYGGEDTDFSESAHAAGCGMCWVGGATAYHQHHPVSSPPVEHLEAIVRNARIFHGRWGWWPMAGWLEKFDELGLIRFDVESGPTRDQ